MGWPRQLAYPAEMFGVQARTGAARAAIREASGLRCELLLLADSQ
jgi:hypothetical protein